jgi:TonB family protein
VRQWLTGAVLLSMVLNIPSAPPARAQEQALGTRKVINRVVPQYPQLARSMRIEGTVKLLAVVAPNGKSTSTRVMGGHPVFAKAAVDAVEKWKWTPGPEETREVLEIHFRPE